ncbi:MAG: hypothetical protein WCS01_11775 [bacterium]
MTKKIVAPLFLGLIVFSVVGCDDYYGNQNKSSREQTAWAAYEKQQTEEVKRREAAWAESEGVMKRQKDMQERAGALLEAQEALVKRQGEQADRFDVILKKWEAMPSVPHQ